MFERHDGFRGVLFATSGEARVVITFWRDYEAAAALERSSDYLTTVAAIQAAGFLGPPQHVELLEINSSHVEGLKR